MDIVINLYKINLKRKNFWMKISFVYANFEEIYSLLRFDLKKFNCMCLKILF